MAVEAVLRRKMIIFDRRKSVDPIESKRAVQ
jgi:hypothetical protein